MSDLKTGGPSPAAFFETLHGFQRTTALKTAIELDVFTAIHDGVTGVEPLAKKCGATPRGIRILCDYLVVIGWHRKEGRCYALTPESEAFAKQAFQTISRAIHHIFTVARANGGV